MIDLDPAYEDNVPKDIAKIQALWRAVILQRITDALSRSSKKEAIVWRDRAVRWLLSGSSDFEIVCELAGVCPHRVRESFVLMQENGLQPCDVRGKDDWMRRLRLSADEGEASEHTKQPCDGVQDVRAHLPHQKAATSPLYYQNSRQGELA